MENGWIWWKNENPCFKIFFGVTLLDLGLKKDEESLWFPKGKNSKYKNGFFTIDSVDRELSGSIFRFGIGWAETEISQIVNFGRQ